MGVMENVVATCEGLGAVELNGIRLETADPRLLDVSEMDLDRHVAMQPAAMAYYGFLKRDAERALANAKREHERWLRRKSGEARGIVAAKYSAKSAVTANEIKAQVEKDNPEEIERREAMLDKLQRDVDALDSWYEAWRQKSFQIREHARIEEDSLFNSSPHIGGGDGGRRRAPPPEAPRSRAERVRSMIEKRRNEAAGQGQ